MKFYTLLYSPDLTRKDGSAFEKQYTEMNQKTWGTIATKPPQNLPNCLILFNPKWWRRRESNPLNQN